MGIVGLSQIGRATAHAFDMRVLATSRSGKNFPDYVTPVALDVLFQESDVAS